MPNETNSELIVEPSTLTCIFLTQRMNNLTLYLLNHIKHVGLKRHYLGICRRGAATTAFR